MYSLSRFFSKWILFIGFAPLSALSILSGTPVRDFTVRCEQSLRVVFGSDVHTNHLAPVTLTLADGQSQIINDVSIGYGSAYVLVSLNRDRSQSNKFILSTRFVFNPDTPLDLARIAISGEVLKDFAFYTREDGTLEHHYWEDKLISDLDAQKKVTVNGFVPVSTRELQQEFEISWVIASTGKHPHLLLEGPEFLNEPNRGDRPKRNYTQWDLKVKIERVMNSIP
jgi:hypothetical protein